MAFELVTGSLEGLNGGLAEVPFAAVVADDGRHTEDDDVLASANQPLDSTFGKIRRTASDALAQGVHVFGLRTRKSSDHLLGSGRYTVISIPCLASSS